MPGFVGRFGATLGHVPGWSGIVLGEFGDTLAPPWEYLEALLGRLEASWGMCRAPWEPHGEKSRGGSHFWIDFGNENGGQFCQVGLAGLQISCAQPVFSKGFSGTCPFQVKSSQGHVLDGRAVHMQEEFDYTPGSF